jgi:hypothetical protein
VSPGARKQVDAALAAAVERVTARAAEILADPSVTQGRWWRELQEEMDGAGRRRRLRAISAWEVHVVSVLDAITQVIDVGLGDLDPADQGLDEPASWRDRL